MAKGVTIDLIVNPQGALDGIDQASGKATSATSVFADLGKIGATAVAAVATAAVAAAGALVGATVSAGKYADEILQASTNTNLSTDTLQAYKYAAEQMDVSFETFTASQGKFTKSMQGATSGTGPAADAFAALGLSVTDSSGNLVDSEKLYWDAVDALGQVSNETERTALAQQIFGKGGAEMNSIIAKGSEGFAALTEEARNNGAIMSGPQLEALGAFDDKMQGLTSTVDAAKNALGLTLLPILDQLAGSGTSALGSFTSALLDANGDLTKAGPAFSELGTNIAGALTSAVPKILQVGTSLVGGLIQGIVAQAPSLIQTAIPLLVTFVSAILAMLPSVLNAGLKVVVALIQGVGKAIPQLIPVAINAILGLVGTLIANLPLILNAGLQLIMGLAQGIIAALPDLIERLPTLILGIVTFLTNAIPTIIETGITLLLSLVDALPEIITGIVDAIPVIIVGLVTALVAMQPRLMEAGIRLFVSLIEALPEIISSLIGAIPQIITGLYEAFTDPKTLAILGKAGLQLIQGLWEGIKGAGDWLWKQLSGFFGGIIDNIRNLLGIHSPSTVTGEMGDNLILGLVNRIRAGGGLVSSVMRDLSDQVTGGFNGALQVEARASVASQYGEDVAPAGASQSAAPQFNMPIYMLPEQDPRIAGRQFGREFALTIAGMP